jgi:uncharacterized membrane protein/glutaredoxin
MGKKAKARRETTGRPIVGGPPLRTAPNWPLLALSAAGLALTGYMAWTAFGNTPVKGCGIGSACDIVLSSDWSTFLGLPTAFWGFLMYAVLAATAFVKRADRHWQYAWTLSLFGFLYSAYLTVVSLTILESACPYCLTSLGLMTAIFALLTWQRPAELPNFSWPGWLAKTAPVPVILILILHLGYSGVIGTPAAPEDPYLRGLAEHLTNTGAKFYGAYWCPHCQDQKKFFGAAARRLPYIECSPDGMKRPQAQVCNEAGVNGYPTWFINGKKVDGTVLIPRQLAELSGFAAPTP